MMNNEPSIPIHETAFMTASFRATYPQWSKDFYAYLWNNSATDKWVKTYLDQVSSEEVFAHCWRNRFFLETIDHLAQQNKIDALVNFGAGFSMYPYLLSNNLIHIEIDKPDVIEHKTSQVSKWQTEGDLPSQKIHSIAIDFSTDYRKELKNKIKNIIKGKRSFILIEGVLYFLSPQITQRLFEFFESVQSPGDYMGSGSFQEVLKENLVFSNLHNYFENNFREEENHYHMLNDDFYWQLPHYKLIQRADYFSLSNQYNHPPQLPKNQILNENFYILKKIR